MEAIDLFVRFRLWIVGCFKLRSRASAAQRIAYKWKCDAFQALRKLNRSMDKLQTVMEEAESEGASLLSRYELIQERVREEVEEALSEMKDARTVIAQYDHTEDALSSELFLIKEGTLKDLALQRELTRSQLKADIALLAGQKPPPSAED